MQLRVLLLEGGTGYWPWWLSRKFKNGALGFSSGGDDLLSEAQGDHLLQAKK